MRIKNFNPKDPNSVVSNYYQIGQLSYENATLLSLLVEIATDPVYDILRNKEQLAYRVSFRLLKMRKIQGYVISVHSQEAKFTTDYVDERIENFRHELLSIIEQMPSDDFEMFKNSLAQNKWIEYDHSGDKLNWQSDSERLDQVSKEVQTLLNITKAELLEFYSTHLNAANQRKLSFQVIGNAHADDGDDSSDGTVESFETLSYVNFTGKPRGILVEDVKEFTNSLEEFIYEEEKEVIWEYDEEDDIYADDEEYEDEGEKKFGDNVSNCVDVTTVIHFKMVFYCWFLFSSFYIFY